MTRITGLRAALVALVSFGYACALLAQCPPATTRVDAANPQTYSAPAGSTVPITLNWYRIPMDANYLRFMHLVNASGQSWSADDQGTAAATWAAGPFSQTRSIALPSSLPAGTYDIRVGLAGGSPWTNRTLVMGAGVTDPGGDQRYKVGTLTVAAGGQAPQIISTPATSATIGVAYSYDVNATDTRGRRKPAGHGTRQRCERAHHHSVLLHHRRHDHPAHHHLRVRPARQPHARVRPARP